jgi:16S rRNA (guanine527-N7)-methyltransferase
VFSSRLPLAERYVELLATEGVVRGLIGPREAPRLWERHLLNCAVLTDALGDVRSVCDVGSGAGLPGLVVAILRPDLEVTLVEPLLRRTVFLQEVVTELGLDRVEVVRGRAEALHGTREFDAVTSRAVAPLGRLLEWSMPLVAPRGSLLALKGSSIAAEIEEARPVLARLGCRIPEIVPLGEGLLEEPTAAVRVVWADPGRVPLSLAATSARARPTSSGRRAKRRGRDGRR